ADPDVFAIAAFPADLLDHAVARRIDRRAQVRGPVDASMHARVLEQWVAPRAEVRGHDALGERLAGQELLRAPAGLVVVVDDAVVGRLIAIKLAGFAGGRE